MTEQTKKRGRPIGRMDRFTFRVRSDLRAKLIESAAASGRSVSEEIEWRLALGFEREKWAVELKEHLAKGGLRRVA